MALIAAETASAETESISVTIVGKLRQSSNEHWGTRLSVILAVAGSALDWPLVDSGSFDRGNNGLGNLHRVADVVWGLTAWCFYRVLTSNDDSGTPPV